MGFTDLELRQGERLLMQGAANKWQTVGSKGGNLFLTDQRIVFKAHALNFGPNLMNTNFPIFKHKAIPLISRQHQI